MAQIRNKLLGFLSKEVAKVTPIAGRDVRAGFLGLTNAQNQELLGAINAGDELTIGQILLAAARAAHLKKAQDKVVTALANEDLTFRQILKRLETL